MVGFYAALRPQNDAAPLADFATALNMLREKSEKEKDVAYAEPLFR